MNRYEKQDINNKLIWKFRDIGHTLRHISEGKGSQRRILIMLNELGPISQSELTQQLGIQPGSASEVIIKLESAGYITRTPSEKDRRTTVVLLTEAGTAAAQQAAALRAERHEQMFDALNADEKETLLSLLEKLNADWEQKYGADAREPRHGYHGHHGHRR
ncbi:MAG: MarR family transcriptional regulator [bacterium]|nr:MarR family transcriptional regulator [bacterium]